MMTRWMWLLIKTQRYRNVLKAGESVNEHFKHEHEPLYSKKVALFRESGVPLYSILNCLAA